MKTIAVIPARSGSKRIVKKNIIDFMGKPLMAWTIEAALKSKIFDRIILSTDNTSFSKIGCDYGIEVPFLREKKNDDLSPISEATIEAIKQAESHYNEKYDIVVQLMANTPLVESKNIIEHYKNFIKSNSSFQISCFSFGWMNPWWAFKMDKDNNAEWLHDKTNTQRSQDLPKLYCPTGAIWIAKVKELIHSKSFYGPGVKFKKIDWKSAVDIDDHEDLAFAKALFYYRKENQK
jgi:CMP-N-acetylneuraminic acid synthetase